ncbi:MAG: ribosome assembly factor SBDS [Candidatus Woesearchaeota archaeon]
MKGDKLIDDHVQISVNLVRFKSHGRTFEVPIDPDKAVEYKEGKSVDIMGIFKADGIFSDAKKGYFAAEDDLKTVFGSVDEDEIKRRMLEGGEIQFTQEYRDQLKKRKERNVLHQLHRHTINPKTGLPHPETRLKAALDEAKVRIDHMKKAEDQIADIVKKLLPIIPISYEVAVLDIHIPAQYAAKLRGRIEGFGNLREEHWLNDGSLLVTVELPGGMQQELLDYLNSQSHGSCTLEKSKRVKA